MPPRGRERRWSWYAQVRDATFALLGMGILVTMTVRNSFPLPGVVAALACAGTVSASAALRYLVGRWDEKP